MSYTTKERNAIYKQALEYFETPTFLCASLNRAIGLDYNRKSCKELFKMFPEFKLFDHDDRCFAWHFSDDFEYWDEKYPQDCRKTVLSFCIAMTENETS